MRKKEIKKLYRLDPQMGSRGRVKEVPVYIGGYYSFDKDVNTFRKVGIQTILSIILSITFFIIGALPDPQGLRQFYIAIPYVCIFMPLAYSGLGAGTMLVTKDMMTEVEYADSFDRVIKSALGIRVILAIVEVAEIIFTILSYKNCEIENETFFFASSVVLIVLNEWRLRYINKVVSTLEFSKQEEKH